MWKGIVSDDGHGSTRRHRLWPARWKSPARAGGHITGHNADYSAQAVRNVCDQYPEVSEKITDLKFKGRSQQLTPVTDAKDIIEIITLLPGNAAARVHRQAAELLCRYLGGDLPLRKRVALLAKLSNWAGGCLKHRAASLWVARCLK